MSETGAVPDKAYRCHNGTLGLVQDAQGLPGNSIMFNCLSNYNPDKLTYALFCNETANVYFINVI